MPTVEYLKDLQSHQKGDTAWLDGNSAAEQEEMGVVKIVAEDELPTLEDDRANTLRATREAAEDTSTKTTSKSSTKK